MNTRHDAIVIGAGQAGPSSPCDWCRPANAVRATAFPAKRRVS